MGRPLNKKYFGEGLGIKIKFFEIWIDGEEEPRDGADFTIIKQTGTGRFKVTDGDITVDIKTADTIAPGFGIIWFTPFEGDPVAVKTIYNRTVTTFDGGSFKWSEDPAEDNGEGDFWFELPAPEPDPEPEPDEDPVIDFTFTAGSGFGRVGFSNMDSVAFGVADTFMIGETEVLSVFYDGVFLAFVQGEFAGQKIDYTINGTSGSLNYNMYFNDEDFSLFLNNQTPYVLEDGETYNITRFAIKPV